MSFLHNPKATANALAFVGGVSYILCAVWTLLSKASFMRLMSTWVHGIDMSALPQKTPDFGTLILGFITFVIAVWITGYAFAVSYNYFAKK